MARRTAKANPTNASEAMELIASTEPLKTVEEAAKLVGVAEIRVLEMFSEALNLPEAMLWEMIPQEHELLLTEFKNQQDAFNSVRALEPEKEATTQSTESSTEVPIVPDESQLQTTDNYSKKPSTALTEKKSEALKTSDQNAQKLASSDLQIKEALHARKGAKTGARLATLELVAEDATYRKIKGEALVRKVGQLTSEIAAESDFDPIQLLAELGINSNSEIFEDLKQQLEPALGKLDVATTEIVQTAWLNGVDLEAELGNLENLLNFNDSTADYWQ
jgi:hypothetical protein